MSKSENKTEWVRFRITKKEINQIETHATKLGYKNNLSTYFRNRILRKDVITVNPNKLIDELNLLRGELNKIGSNINQITNYCNFLLKNKYTEDVKLDDFKNVIIKYEIKTHQLKEVINKTFDKI